LITPKVLLTFGSFGIVIAKHNITVFTLAKNTFSSRKKGVKIFGIVIAKYIKILGYAAARSFSSN
jgi:hypothetical protein